MQRVVWSWRARAGRYRGCRSFGFWAQEVARSGKEYWQDRQELPTGLWIQLPLLRLVITVKELSFWKKERKGLSGN